MNEVEPRVEDEATGDGKALPVNRNAILVIAAALVLIASGLLFFTQVNSSPGCAGEGPCMLYFYADW